MTPRDFVYWLQGCLELGCNKLDEKQVKVIKEHLALVLKHEKREEDITRITRTPTGPGLIC